MQARAFNKIDVNYFTNTVVKSSENKIKLQDEINYYLNLPKKMAHYFPKLLSYRHDFSSYTLEYIPYKTLGELFIKTRISSEEGKKIITQLLTILDEFHSVRNNSSSTILNNIYEFYIKKTLQRVDELKKDPFFSSLLQADYLFINKQFYKNFFLLEEEFIHAIKKQVKNINAFTLIQ